MWILVVVLLGSTAGFAGLWLDTRSANVTLQNVHARATAWAAWRINSLQFDNLVLSQACDRWAKFDRIQVRKIADQAREIHDLRKQLEEEQAVSLLKEQLGAAEICTIMHPQDCHGGPTLEQQAAIDRRLSEL